MLVLGILCGLAAAAGQAVTYLLSRRYLAAGHSPGRLWVCSQLWMALFTAPLIPLLWRVPDAGWTGVSLPLVGALAGVGTAQAFFYLTVRHVAASRVAPLMGIKILFVALLALAFDLTVIGPQQWLGVGLALVAALAIQRSAQPVSMAGLLGVVATCLAFAVSDISITELMLRVEPTKSFASILFCIALVYTLGAVVTLAVLPVVRPTRAAMRDALPYALMWLVSMMALFAAIGWAGVVLAIILQALRGPLSIVFGFLVARAGHHHLEAPTDGAGLRRQLLAAALMVAATVVYVTGG